MRSGLDETKFHQMWRRPTGAPPNVMIRAAASARDDGGAGPDDGEVAGRDALALDLDVAVDDQHGALLVLDRQRQPGPGSQVHVGVEQRRRPGHRRRHAVAGADEQADRTPRRR